MGAVTATTGPFRLWLNWTVSASGIYVREREIILGSPDEQWMLFSQEPAWVAELIVIENFR